MCRVLLVYATHYGQTARIAQRIADALKAQGHDVQLLDAPAQLAGELDSHDAVIIGGSVQYGRHDRALERAIARNADRLACFPNAFFSVSMSAARPGKGVAEAQANMERFLGCTGWRPRLMATFGGALAYTRYPAWKRWMIRLISSSQHGAQDTSRDHEYTDWAAVERFCAEIAGMLPRLRPAHAA